ncbi:MAG: hypothetical protein L0220_05625, partial [Acidobacteria bacterium]|nr:hypothetical protein [Acidobacteriota bacterium]
MTLPEIRPKCSCAIAAGCPGAADKRRTRASNYLRRIVYPRSECFEPNLSRIAVTASLLQPGGRMAHNARVNPDVTLSDVPRHRGC